MKADLRVLNLFFDPAGRLFGLLDDPSTKRPEVKTQRYVFNLLPAM